MNCGDGDLDLITAFRESGKTRLLITGDRPPQLQIWACPIRLPDRGQIYKLQPSFPDACSQALQLRAFRLRGFELPEDVGRFYQTS